MVRRRQKRGRRERYLREHTILNGGTVSARTLYGQCIYFVLFWLNFLIPSSFVLLHLVLQVMSPSPRSH
jgi:hypothetical protein